MSLGSVISEIEKYRVDLVGIQEVRWEGGGNFESGNYILHYGEGNAKHQLETGFLVNRRITLAVERVEFFSDLFSCVRLKGI